MVETLFYQDYGAFVQRQPGAGAYVVTTYESIGERVGTVGPREWPVSWVTAQALEREGGWLRCELEASAYSMTVQPDTVAAGGANLAITFGEHLRRYRQQQFADLERRCCVTSAIMPCLQAEEVRFPHLLSVIQNGQLTDTVVWEVLKRSAAEAWLGDELPDQALFENNLLDILAIRKALRRQSLPDTPLYRELQARHRAGRYLSMLFVYRNANLFGRLLEEPPHPQKQTWQRSAS